MRIKLFLFLPAIFMGVIAFNESAYAQVCDTAQPLTCTAEGFCDIECGACWTCDATTNTCVPDDSFCDGFSGGLEENVCRSAICVDASVGGVINNPTGCDYSIDLAATSTECVLCEETPSPISNCGNGSCEPGLGETCANCAIDCLVPGFDEACPRDNSDEFCGPTITFDGPPWDGTFSICEDGDVCTTNACDNAGVCLPADPITTCSGDGSDLCCPSGCTPPPDGPGSCPDLLGTTCDVDCYVPQDCVPTPSPTPTPPPPVTGLCLSGTSLISGESNPAPACDCSLNPNAPMAPGKTGAMGLMGIVIAAFVISLRKKARSS